MSLQGQESMMKWGPDRIDTETDAQLLHCLPEDFLGRRAIVKGSGHRESASIAEEREHRTDEVLMGLSRFRCSS
jgi:hypothetical protein